jgi:uncharacterized Zn-binding protein involved in type VI secretion
MSGLARVGDRARCPEDRHDCAKCAHDVIGPAVDGSPDVLINNKSALRIGDPGIHASCCGDNSWFVEQGGSTQIVINGRPAAVLGSSTRHCGGTGAIVQASDDVLTG